jgi:hypothetical protein
MMKDSNWSATARLLVRRCTYLRTVHAYRSALTDAIRWTDLEPKSFDASTMMDALHDCVGDSVGHCACLEILSKFDHPHDLPPLIAAQSAVCHLISVFATELLPHTFD